jgi:hypothetical protein
MRRKQGSLICIGRASANFDQKRKPTNNKKKGQRDADPNLREARPGRVLRATVGVRHLP